MDLPSSYEEDGYGPEVMMAILEVTKRVDEHVLSFKSSMLGHQALNRHWAHGHVLED